MLSSAVQRYQQQRGLPFKELDPVSSNCLGNTSRSQSGLSLRGASLNRDPLKRTSPSKLNGLISSQNQQKRHHSGRLKRTTSGLTKVVEGSFEDDMGAHHNPIIIGGPSPRRVGVTQFTSGVIIDENDFDSDIDLDIEEPPLKKTATYPSLPQLSSRANSFTKPLISPSPSRRQQVQTNASQDRPPQYDLAAAPQLGTPQRSSAPLQWSSSPAEHHVPAAPASRIGHFAYNADTANSASVVRPSQLEQPGLKNASRRKLPWATQPQQEEETQLSASGPRMFKTAAQATPASKDNKYPWNTTASAVKEQQKKHREESKRAVKKVEDDEISVQVAKTKNQRPARVFLSEEQQHVLELVLEHKKSVFFTGSAGTGKSVLMREIIKALRTKFHREPDRVAVTASTGLAACNVGGVTLHSFAGIGLGKEDVPELVRKIKKNQKAKHRWLRTKVLVVDEVSMVDGELFDKLEAIARQLRNNGRPFGGIQLVVTGDFFQLPPVPDNGRVAKFAFDAGTWNTTVEHTIALHHVFRQKDPIFAGMLNEMREGRLQASSVQAFRELSRPMNFEDDLVATELFPTRAEVDQANNVRMRDLQGTSFPYEARDGGAIIDKMQRDKLLSNCMAPENIILKKGAQVMLIKNIDESLVNGSLGKVRGFMTEPEYDSYTRLDDDLPSQGLSNADADLDGAVKKSASIIGLTVQRRWPVVRFVLADGTSRDLLCQPESWKVELPNGEVQASRSQIPLILAWALSIHKAQGQTLERVKVDLGKVFEKGQAYVALSRATSMQGLQVLRFDPKKVIAHDRVRTFYSNLSRVELAEKSEKKRKIGTLAEEYEKRFVHDEWTD